MFIKHPLSNDRTYTHEPVTTQYDANTVLINLSFWGLGREREVACLLIKGNTVTKISWNVANEFDY